MKALAQGSIVQDSWRIKSYRLGERGCAWKGRLEQMSATSEDNSRDRVTWEDIVAFDEAIKKKGGRFSEEDLIKMFELNDKLDKSTLPEGVKFPLGYQGVMRQP